MSLHGHDHPHDHTPPPDRDGAWKETQYLEVALRELLIEKGVIDAGDLQAQVDRMDSRSPEGGSGR